MTGAATLHTVRPGDPAPRFTAATTGDGRCSLASAAGRYVVLCFLGSAGRPEAEQALEAVTAQRALFDGKRAVFVGVTVDQQDLPRGRLPDMPPGIRFALDFDLAVSRLYGAVSRPAAGQSLRYRPFWLVLDPMLHVLGRFTLGQVAEVLSFLATLPPVGAPAGVDLVAPVLVLPRVLEPDLCRRLIGLYEANRQADDSILDEATREAVRSRILARVAPEVHKFSHFRASRTERDTLACYDARLGGQPWARRDDAEG